MSEFEVGIDDGNETGNGDGGFESGMYDNLGENEVGGD